jgi:hypothetical protein
MKRAKGFFVFCLFVCIVFGFPIIVISGHGGGGGGGGAGGSAGIEGDIHSNSVYTSVSHPSAGSGCSVIDINGTVSAVGTADVVCSDVTATGEQSSAAHIDIPKMDFAALQAANGETIGATEVMYIDGDVYIDLSDDITTYQNKTIVATGNIEIDGPPGGGGGPPTGVELRANLIARGSIDIEFSGGNNDYEITGFIYAGGEGAINVDGENFTGVYIDLNAGGPSTKKITGIIMAKNGSCRVDMHVCGPGDKGIDKDASVTNGFIPFFKTMTYWREIPG